jgi:16S rRNA (adenine1518-N6/adenine1519-N6)-dimethyltransferase
MRTERHARKRFGQHFLHDAQVIAQLVAAIAPRAGEHIVEIGPGLGALTLPLLKTAGALTVVELDRDLIAPLRERCAGLGALSVHQGDALRFDFAALVTAVAGAAPLRVVGNLPYNISTPLLFHLCAQAHAIRDMHFMLQAEVVARLAAAPGTADYGRLSVMIQYRCAVMPLLTIGPQSFSPPPRVESAFVRLVPHASPPVPVQDEATFERLVRAAFAQRRKTLRNALSGLLASDAIQACGVDLRARAETLALDDFARLANRVAGGG